MASLLDEGGGMLLDEALGDIYDEAGTPAPVGSWWGLDSVFKQNRSEFESFISRPPVACPVDGEPLINAPATMAGSGCQLYCKYDGWQYPRDYVAPSRPMPG
jgi:hypothetical protein